MRFRLWQSIIAVIVTAILVKITNQWQMEWWKIGVPYFLGMVAMILVSAEPKHKRPTYEIIEDMEKEIRDAIETQPQSATEILDYISRCKQFCKDSNL